MALGLTACTKIQSRDLIREGNTLYKNGQFVEAIEKYDASLELEPGGITVQWNRAMAAESIVLALKDSTDEADLARRKEYATVALEALSAWNDGRDKPAGFEDVPACSAPKADEEGEEGEEAAEADAEEGEEAKGDPELEAYKGHRLAILGADARCDDLIEHWRQMHMACPQNEDLYMTIAQTFEDICGMPDKADEWYVKRTEDFPESSKAWYSLATRRFGPLFPDVDSGLPFNSTLDASRRMEIADEVIKLLTTATEIEPKYRDPYVWRSMAYTQKSLAREYLDPPDTPDDAIEAIMARRDSMMAWKETKAVCDIDKIPDCPIEPEVTELFTDFDANPDAWKEQEISLWGHVVDETVKQIESHVWEIGIEIEVTPPPAEGEEGAEAPPPAPEGEGEEGEAPAKTMQMVTVRYTFLKPVAVEGEEAPDNSEEVQAQVDLWQRQKSTNYTGFLTKEGDTYVLLSKQKQFLGCCPPAPITAEEETADEARLKELYEQKKAEEEAAEAGKGKGKKGKGR
ncbi:hypothetical protein PPSIR1_11838 [Plesiocystis pacifica SIR-1]|uniref:Uncharacterized protein n=2 Tax=Plesiocystis pacifica TaxID=191768 RepID=A6GKR4_9BACT|nr:hypothetical protein PPSIR1_11838 [Plesiocystis pacifica SIR-1]